MDMRKQINTLIEQVTKKDLNATLALLSDDAILEDPHYPRKIMRGKQQIEKGLAWGFKGMREFRFEIVHYFEDKQHNTCGIETHCTHILSTGKQLDFKQVFIFEFKGELFSRISAYLMYRPNGLLGFILKINHTITKILGRA